MRYLKYIAVLAILLVPVAYSQAQVAVGIRVGTGYGYVGPAPVCPYGYYAYYPYACAPYGYYAPRWFVNGVFIGAGPWFRGFYGPGFAFRQPWYGPRWYGYRGYYRPSAYGYYRGGYVHGPVRGFHRGWR